MESYKKPITFIFFIKPPQLVRDFVENYFIHDLTDEAVKEICQLEHPKIMLVQLNPETIFTAKVIEQESDHDIYGDEKENFKVGIFEQDIMLAEGEGSPLSQAEKNACRNLLKEKYLDRLKTADLPFNLSEYEINFGLLPEGIRVVEIEKGINGFGFSVKGGEMRSEENREFVKYHYYFPPFISSVVDNGPGERVGLREGDVILAVNNKSTKGMDHYHFVRYLKSLKGKVKFTVKNSERVLIIDEIETKFRKFKERKMVSQLADQQWSKWHLANSQKNHDEYERHLREKSRD
ncbi:uncharacterized protein LOC124435303 [Xenia sp. Carnegie-2017]|uniref:uncharacterized protein LOC124435303 n=1 Tax=Xenia sp. Carnegie-2017 TaxID=2897299 RepID=UPI001F045590|nr:uncharacterized protein LOC124435303 [Xenia sp. Carnegie-2017]